jgi:uncharacterized protein YcnI
MKKLLTGLGAAVVLVLAVAAPASAHIEPTIAEAPAGGYATVALTVPHGCDGAATTKIEVQMPEGVAEPTPQFLPGWEASVDDSDGVVVTWEGGPLPDGQFLQFGLSIQMPDTPGETAVFPTVQTCEGGASTDWTTVAVEGEEEPEHPAPAIAITEASEEGHHGGGEETDREHAEEEGSDEAAADTHDESASESEDSDTLAIVALVVGALGLLAAGYAIMSTRRAS